MRRSDWSADPLTPSQIEYAAGDAIASYKVAVGLCGSAPLGEWLRSAPVAASASEAAAETLVNNTKRRARPPQASAPPPLRGVARGTRQEPPLRQYSVSVEKWPAPRAGGEGQGGLVLRPRAGGAGRRRARRPRLRPGNRRRRPLHYISSQERVRRLWERAAR